MKLPHYTTCDDPDCIHCRYRPNVHEDPGDDHDKLRVTLADAWEEGWSAAVADSRSSRNDLHINPYRAALQRAEAK